MTTTETTATTNLSELAKEIEELRLATRPDKPLELIAVSKTHPMEKIRPLIDAGHLHFGENRVQEAQQKWSANEKQKTQLHLIGPLQGNKVRVALQLFDYIHSLDSLKLAQRISNIAEELTKAAPETPTPKILIQVNTGEEPQKAGVMPTDAPKLIDQARDLGLPLVGLMAIPPLGDLPAPHFALLGKLAKAHQLEHLSMGMSQDWNIAVELGASFLRIGSKIFGARGQ